MLAGRKRSSGSFGADGRRLEGTTTTVVTTRKTCEPSSCHGTNKLFQPGAKLMVRRAPVISGLSVPAGLQKKFQRPMTKRRAYSKNADEALRRSSLGPKRRMDGMSKLMARAGRGLTYKLPRKSNLDGSDEDSDEEEARKEKENERPFEPLLLWTSPHEGGEAIGLPKKPVKEMQCDEYGVEEEVTVMRPAPPEMYAKKNVFVPPVLAKWLRPHQREGVQFMYECVMGLKEFEGQGCILADDMGLGKTLQSVTLIYTLLKTSIVASNAPTARRVIVVCPCSLVKNWDNEFVKWLGPNGVKTMALAESDRKTVEKNLNAFVKTTVCNVLIASYETIRTHVKILTKSKECCDLLVCDEAHRLKNSENQTSRALNSLPVKRRVLLTGTPMQNDLQEFYAMVDFTNPGVLGTPEQFRKNMLFPILRGREPDATEAQKRKMMEIQQNMSMTVNEFILRRVNTLNAQHLPPKLVQVVCCNLTEIQQNMYQHLVNSKDMQHVLDGKQVNALGSIQALMKLCNHPSLIVQDETADKKKPGRRAASKNTKYTEDETTTAAPGADGIAKFLPYDAAGGGRGMFAPVHPEWSGKMYVLYRLMKEMRKPGNGGDKIVIVSNYTQTLDLIGRMCKENSWGFCRLDGSITMKKRQKMVDEFNDPSSSLIAFLLSSKAGGCGLNLIGGNRLVLFDPDWNPAVDKQAAARCWRDGQKKRCFTYRFLATGTVEEKIYQRQLSKEGLQSVVDDKEQVNALSTKDLRNLFKLRSGTPSDTHDKLRCERCKIIADHTEMEAMKVLPKKLDACRELLTRIEKHEDAALFLKPLVPDDHGVTKEEYEKVVKQPMDLGTIRTRLNLSAEKPQAYNSVSGFSKDVNRIFSNVMKVWSPGDDIADAARRLQAWWVEEWTALVPVLMNMKLDDEKPAASTDESPMECDDEAPIGLLNNERGEDYQEQIGMPDEENMRSWSHHYSTDTVDDPVFRAAMRGTDAVSFIFGLEVTWDLIQQRQQEEEDRKAMEAMEEDACAIEALNDALEDGDESDGEGGKKLASDEEADDDSPEPSKKRAKTKSSNAKAKPTSTDNDADDEATSDEEEDTGEMNDFIIDDEEEDGEESVKSGGSGGEEMADEDGDDDDSTQSGDEIMAEADVAEADDDAPSPVKDVAKEDDAETSPTASSSSDSSSGEEETSQSTQDDATMKDDDDDDDEATTPPRAKSDDPTQSSSSGSSGGSGSSCSEEETSQSTQDDDADENMDEQEEASAQPTNQASEATGKVELKKGQWQCQVCTLVNNGRRKKCATCETPKNSTD